MCQKVSNKNVIIQSENITFFHFIITFMITFLNYIELIFIQNVIVISNISSGKIFYTKTLFNLILKEF